MHCKRSQVRERSRARMPAPGRRRASRGNPRRGGGAGSPPSTCCRGPQLSALRRQIRALRRELVALRSAGGADWRVECIVGDSWLTSGFEYHPPNGTAIFVANMAPSAAAWEEAFAFLRHRARGSNTPPVCAGPGSEGAGRPQALPDPSLSVNNLGPPDAISYRRGTFPG